ncbi:cation:proton antiporter family protein [Phycisphaera mikurensis]|uniref:Putative antiporter n=1 Tax=Phycisphaera mikurensis (strain NBRC 102666 / KCTC 22515 / FYK2301M01) TaxID=1142394 RepID=I0IB37_PHYMF|nr:cation:proton antiporter family protein [Phycisphaera mikurensis]MBB6442976.1 putative Kef-type K+ transport protein [Phycisphaera mikurensis]BAM02475.1 putative antiporter [Phycisphaera mikurensis NBRC 102666]
MDPIWVVIAFLVGLAVRQLGLPPMVGFLGAGFVLSGIGVEPSDTLDTLADLGIHLLLFSIGLKLDLRGLAKPEVWGVASAHMAATTLGVGVGLFGLSLLGLGIFAELSWSTSLLIAFALSFSSTVFAVKVLEDKAELKSRHGDEAIGVLIVQDLFAIVFLTASLGKVPSPWAVGLLALPLVRPLLKLAMDRVGHGELLLLSGLVLVYGFTELFTLLKMKPDLGALIAGLLIGSHPKASELSKSLLGLKDLLLVAFFLTIGLNGLPGPEQLGIAVALVLLVPLKAVAFFWLMTRFRLRARTAMLSAVVLANASEFGLIVGALGADKGWISREWLVVLAITVSLSFVLAAPFNAAAHRLFARWQSRLLGFETQERLPDDRHIELERPPRAVVIAMGRVGTAAYDALRERLGEGVIGLDVNRTTVERHAAAGRTVVHGDATDPDFYARLSPDSSTELVVISLQAKAESNTITRLIRARGYTGHIVAMARFPDEIDALRAAGVDAACYLHDEMGLGLARSALDRLDTGEDAEEAATPAGA